MGGYRYSGKSSSGEAVWVENPPVSEKIDESRFGLDDGVAPKKGGAPISVTDEKGSRGELVYTVGTVYTDITLDGERDAAYDYGVHLKGFVARDPEYYVDRETSIEVWMVRGQDGRLYVYGEITDPDIVTDDELFGFKPHYCDCLHPYVDYGNVGQLYYPSIALSIIPVAPEKYPPIFPKCGGNAKLTEKGYSFEYALDNKGKPFMEGDEFAFGFFYNDSNDFVSLESYQHSLGCLPSSFNLAAGKYFAPDAKYFDALRFTERSAVTEICEKSDAQKCGDLFKDMISGAATVGIVFGDTAMAQSVLCVREMASRLACSGIKTFRYRQDSAEKTSGCDIEILVDYTYDSLSRELEEKLEYNEYGMMIKGNKIAILGWREEALAAAKELFFSALEYVKAGGSTEELDSFYKGGFDGIISVPKMDKITLVSDVGEEAYQPLLLDADESDFDAYLKKLLDNGYKVYTENNMVSVKTFTLVNEDKVITLSYGREDRSLRAVAEPLAHTSLPALEKETYAPVCASSITQLSPTRVGWMSYVIKQDNGEYFIIDAGSNGGAAYIYEKLMEMSGGKEIVVSNWIFTHFHIDHIGGFVALVRNDEYMKKIKVKSITYNFPQKQVLDTAPGPGDQNNLKAWADTLKKTGAKLYQARTGQKYYFGNVELELLFTYEDLMPFNIFGDRTNPTSHIFTVKVAGQKLMILGDACGEATTLCVKRYGDYMKSDFVQLSHHGMGDGGTDPDFYKKVDADWVLYPSVRYRPSPSEAWACDNAKEYFLNSNNATEIMLPFDGSPEKVALK